MYRTSETDPLKIAFVAPRGGGRIGMTLCPGKQRDHTMDGGHWRRNLDMDLGVVVRSDAAALVTLMEQRELDLVKVSDIGDRAEKLGLEWHRLPIFDVDVPGSVFERRWTYSGHRLRQMLREGKTVVLHCMGGRGRTGTIAARLLVEMGTPPEDAIRAVRTARPGTIETTQQEDYVRRCKRPPLNEKYVDRVLGCLLGGAVGDALGYPIEIHNMRGGSGDRPCLRAPMIQRDGTIQVTDDTQMTLFTLEGVARAVERNGWSDHASVIGQVRLAYLDWLHTQGGASGHEPVGRLWCEATLNHDRAAGITCLTSLSHGGLGAPDNRINDSKGCGGVMRVAPIGLVLPWPPAEAFDIASRTAAITHGHPSGYLSAGAMAATVRRALDGAEVNLAIEDVLPLLKQWHDSDETNSAVQKIFEVIAEGRPSKDAISKLGEGWVGEEALAIGSYCAIVADSFPDALISAANHRGDADSTASIAGQLYGAVHGLADLPNK
jgi:ADP-ribosyl-[dinitrogen reductase] hydrolase